MKTIGPFFLSLAMVGLLSCDQKNNSITIKVKNTLAIERSFETVVLSKAELKRDELVDVGIKDTKTGELQITQLVDYDGDGVMDEILFQPKVDANAESTYEVVTITDAEKPKVEELCFSRFVPERTDDYAWENDRVAFRMYGPTAQKMVEDKVPGGTLSSGVDAWLKRVEYPIINKWYKKETDKTGTYHEDTGEGLDNFHVGLSRGVGGMAIKKDSTYYLSKNYTEWKTITTGPIRTSFYLKIGDWDVEGNTIQESKIISLDRGSNLSKFEVSIQGTDQVSAGLTLHEKDGVVKGNKEKGWVSYWQPHAESEIGTAIVAAKNTFTGYEKYDTDVTDLSNAYAHLKVADKKVIYYAGFGWTGSGQFKTQQAWETYLNDFSERLNHPLQVTVTP